MLKKHRDVMPYALVGGGVAFLDLILFYIFVDILSLNYLFVNFFGFLFGTALNYLLCIKLVFKSGVRFDKPTEVSLILILNIATLLASQGLIFLLIEVSGLPSLFSKLLTISLLFLWNYTMRKYFVFKRSAF